MRNGVELAGGSVTTINADLRVAVAESITVTSETPVVDVQSARQQTVMSGEIVRSLPASRGYGNYPTFHGGEDHHAGRAADRVHIQSVPKVDVLVSTIIRSQPNAQPAATTVATQGGPMAAADGCSQPASGALQRAV